MDCRRLLAVCLLLLGVVCVESKSTFLEVSDEELLEIFKEDDTRVKENTISKTDLVDLESLIKRILKAQTVKNVIDYGSESAAMEWLKVYNEELADMYHQQAEAEWKYLTNLTEENAQKATEVSIAEDEWYKKKIVDVKEFVKHVEDFKDPIIKRMLTLIINSRLIPISQDPNVIKHLSELQNSLESIYAQAKVPSQDGGSMLSLDPDLSEILQTSRDYNELLWVWQGWRNATGPQTKKLFEDLVETMNEAAQENGLSDVGVAWRLLDFEQDDIESTVIQLWEEMRPLYESLHAYVRRKLINQYPQMKGGEKEPIPAHLLGNMWAQEWVDIYDLVKPFPNATGYDMTDALLDQGYTPTKMFELADEFFQSLGMDPMTDTFWNKSMIVRPSDREVECHASAEDFYKKGDFRIKMCTAVNGGALETIHHEMGHIQYFMQYAGQWTLLRNGANAAFHEAVGDTIALAVNTPAHLNTIGLTTSSNTKKQIDKEAELNYLMLIALKKIAFLPFGYLIDKWRWDVFNGTVGPEKYNEHWWKLRRELQGLKPPTERNEEDFDPGAKYHVCGNVPYLRYFLSHIGQFQFYEALCKASGHEGAIHLCDFYNSKEAGNKFMDMLSLGASKPWPDAMETITGQREFRAGPMLEYFKPLSKWLDEQNEGKHVGWDN